MTSNQFLTLNSGHKMPIIGLGTWNASDQEVEASIDAALEVGYRHIDTAPVYRNEKAIGRVLKRWLDAGKVKREELFIVTKLPTFANRASDVEATIKKSLADLQLDYVDIYLIHSPVSSVANADGSLKLDADGLMVPDLEADITTTWTAMEKLVSSGLAKSVGVSNFDQEQLERVLKVAKTPPATNQIEHHVYLQQRDLVDFCKAKGIVITAYSPLGSNGRNKVYASAGINRELPNLFDIPEVKEIATAHGKTPAQVLLRWIVDNGIVIIPKSLNRERLKQNLNVFDFKLTTEEVAKLSALDQNFRICDWCLLPGAQRHPEYKF